MYNKFCITNMEFQINMVNEIMNGTGCADLDDLRCLNNRSLDLLRFKAKKNPEKLVEWAPIEIHSITDLDHEVEWIKLEREVYPELNP
jgi:hypothetical protein